MVQVDLRIPVRGSDARELTPTVYQEAVVDSGASTSQLGQVLAHSMGLRRRDVSFGGYARSFSGREEPIYVVTGLLGVRHWQRFPIHRYKYSVFKIDLAVPPGVFPDGDNPDDTATFGWEVDTLVGQDVLSAMTSLGERKGRPPYFSWVLYECEPNWIDSYWSGKHPLRGKRYPYRPFPTMDESSEALQVFRLKHPKS